MQTWKLASGSEIIRQPENRFVRLPFAPRKIRNFDGFAAPRNALLRQWADSTPNSRVIDINRHGAFDFYGFDERPHHKKVDAAMPGVFGGLGVAFPEWVVVFLLIRSKWLPTVRFGRNALPDKSCRYRPSRCPAYPAPGSRASRGGGELVSCIMDDVLAVGALNHGRYHVAPI